MAKIGRGYSVPRAAPSPAQLRTRAIFGRVRSQWRTLTEAQRALWTAAAYGVKSRRKLNQDGDLPGYLLYVKVNAVLAFQGEPAALTPPPRPTFDASPVGQLVSTNTGGVADLKLAVKGTPATDIIVLGTAPRSAGVYYANHFTILGRLPAPVDGFSHIRQLYVDRYGEPAAGTKIFIRTRQLRDGWEDFPIQTSALIAIA